MTYEKIKERYKENYIRDDQLDRFVTLSVITSAQAEEIKSTKIEDTPINRGGVL